jgi:hypothetical protein
MHYEGIEEFICVRGHYTSCDSSAYGPGGKPLLACPLCGGAFEYTHSIDLSGPPVQDDAACATRCAPKLVTGSTDLWHHDHHGHRYATKLMLYRPAHPAWQAVARPEAALSASG